MSSRGVRIATCSLIYLRKCHFPVFPPQCSSLQTRLGNIIVRCLRLCLIMSYDSDNPSQALPYTDLYQSRLRLRLFLLSSFDRVQHTLTLAVYLRPNIPRKKRLEVHLLASQQRRGNANRRYKTTDCPIGGAPSLRVAVKAGGPLRGPCL